MIHILQEQSRQASEDVQSLKRVNEVLRVGQTQPLSSDKSRSIVASQLDDSIHRHSNSAAQKSSSTLQIGNRATDGDNAAPATAFLNSIT